MGHVRTLTGKRATTFQACWRDMTGRQRTATFPTRRLATAFLRQQQADELAGVALDPASARTTFGEWEAQWRSTLMVSPATVRRIEQQMRCWLLPRWESVPLGQITSLSVQTWAAETSRSYTPSTVRNAVALLSQVLAAAVRARVLPANPAKLERGALPRHRRPREVHLDAAGVAELVEAVRHTGAPRDGAQAAALVHVAAWTGLRWGELTALRWGDVVLERQATVLQVRRAVKRGATGTVVGPPKTDSSSRDVVCDDETRRVLLELRLAGGQGEADQLVFATARTRNVLHHGHWCTTHLHPARAACGLDEAFTFHQLRHTHASLMIAGGMNILTLSRRLGHASAKMTLDRYGHLQRDHVAATLQALEAAKRSALG